MEIARRRIFERLMEELISAFYLATEVGATDTMESARARRRHRLP